MVKVIGYNHNTWTNKTTGEVINQVEVYCEVLNSPIEAGNMVVSYKFDKCIPLELGEVYDEVTKPVLVPNQYGKVEPMSKTFGLKEVIR